MSVVEGILLGAESMGLSADQLCRSAKIDHLKALRNGRITGIQFAALWRAIERLSNDRFCGLRIGEKTTPSSAHILGYLIMNCETLGQAIERFSQYQRIVSDIIEIKLVRSGTYSYLTLHLLDKTLTDEHSLIEWVIAGEAALLSSLAKKPVRPVKVCFTHRAPHDISEHNRFFSAPVLFSQSINALVLPSVELSAPIRHSDPELFSMFERKAREYLRLIERSIGYADMVRKTFISLLPDGRPSLKQVSAKLRIGSRTLQLKLQAEGTSYQDVLHQTRRDLALGYLKDDQLTVSEISYLLGFSEPSVFLRAFRRWTGNTPGSYRKGVAR